MTGNKLPKIALIIFLLALALNLTMILLTKILAWALDHEAFQLR